MRTVYIPGLGEETWIFNNIHQHIPTEKVFIENWTLLAEVPEKGLTVNTYAEFLVKRFQITKEDVIIGHSMGGWIALAIKQITGSRAIQISSWTDGKKVVAVPLYRHLMYLVAKQGWAFNELSREAIVWLYYRNQPSKKVFVSIFERMRLGDKEIVAKQLMLIYNSPKPPITVYPDLRIHAKPDHIVKCPDEAFIEVPGDHFSLYTYPETVYNPIAQFLQQ